MTDNDAYNVMVVDDSAVIRGLISKTLESDPHLKVIASVGDGQHAVTMLQRQTNIEVIVLDIEMPVMDGLTAIPKLLEVNPHVKIVMSSTLTVRNAEVSLQALELGAADYIPKPSSMKDAGDADNFRRELIDKVKTLGALARRAMQHGGSVLHTNTSRPAPAPGVSAAATIRPAAHTHVVTPHHDTSRPIAREPVPAATQDSARPSHLQLNEGPLELRHGPVSTPDIIAIGSSTGGPQALFEVVKSLKDLTQPIIVTQHMPATFTTILAQHITTQCGVPASEAVDGEKLLGGRIYIAPGDYHMVITGTVTDPRIALNQNPPENFCRPAVDPMLRSIAAVYGRNKVLVAILTGMGADGARGCQTVVEAGGAVIAQDEATSVVWGMPAAVAKLGLCHAVLPLKEIGPWLRDAAMGKKAKG